MATIAKSLASDIADKIERLEDETLLQGAMATSALVAMADGRLVIEEAMAVGAVIENLELLKVYDPHYAVSLHSSFVERLRADPVAGKQEALDAIARCADDLEASELLVKVGIAIAKADFSFTTDEAAIVDEICRCINVEGLDALGLTGLETVERVN